ncbi:MAG: HAD-IIA family hydrolase [Eubacteriales bacterium]|nr:HAD-IIA family hydrolase [Eubacteriales bacterium]
MGTFDSKQGFLCDMDGVIYHGNQLLDGAAAFVRWLNETGKRFLFLTNSSERAPRELQQKLERLGLDVGEEHFYTSALATADFLKSQSPGATAYVVGEPGLMNALYEAGITMNDVNPDYVVIGETRNYNYENIRRSIKFVLAGAKLIGTNPDITGPGENNTTLPACRALVSPIALSTGVTPYFLGKPNPLMMRTGIRLLGVDPADAAIVGDRMDTDIIAGIETGADTILVLSGVTTREMLPTFPYQPRYILNGIGDIVTV